MSFPHYNQIDIVECGPTCLRIISKYYGKSLGADEVRKQCHISKYGVTLLGISDAAEYFGFISIGVKLTWEQFKNQANFPCIVHWNQTHFAVVYDIREKRGKTFIYISDPASRDLLIYQEKDFLKSWISIKTANVSDNKGMVLLLEPSPAFFEDNGLQNNEKKYSFKHLFKYLRPHKHSIIHMLFAMVIASALSMVLPFITQSIVDQGISLGRLDFVKVMLVAQLCIVLGELANDLIRSWLMLHTTARVSISLISNFLAKLMRLPISFFDIKMTGDILQRIQDHKRIQDFLTNSVLGMTMAIVLFIIYGIILGIYNLTILVIFLIGTLLYIGWVFLFLKWRRRLDYMRFQQAANNQANIVQLVAGIQDIKLNNCEKQKRWEWERIQAKLFKISIKGLTLAQAQQVGGTFINQLKNIVISFLAAKSVIDGNMTLGMMTALQYIIGQLNAPVSQFISFVRSFQDSNISLERLGEIHNQEDEEPIGSEKLIDIPQNGDIDLHNVIYQYEGPHSPKVLNNISCKIQHNTITAIVGASGSGKTTLLKLMLGYYQPIEGSVTLANVAIKNYSESQWRRNCGCVMQEGYIFSNTIAENIGLCDETPDLQRVKSAANIANLSGWIEQLPLGYNTKIGSNGQGLSTGQKQRILIARAAYKNSPYLFFDEATNSLDANNEKEIMDNLDKLFINKTVVIVAHRLSTVKNADKIIVLNKGHIAEEGTHDELVAKRGYYFDLVKNQLELGL